MYEYVLCEGNVIHVHVRRSIPREFRVGPIDHVLLPQWGPALGVRRQIFEVDVGADRTFVERLPRPHVVRHFQRNLTLHVRSLHVAQLVQILVANVDRLVHQHPSDRLVAARGSSGTPRR